MFETTEVTMKLRPANAIEAKKPTTGMSTAKGVVTCPKSSRTDPTIVVKISPFVAHQSNSPVKMSVTVRGVARIAS